MGSLVQILLFIINIVWFIVIAHVVMSWLIGFNVLNRHQPLVWQIWNGLERLLEPIYGPIRRVLPSMGGLDLSPLVLIVILYALQTILDPQRRHLLLGAGGTPAGRGRWRGGARSPAATGATGCGPSCSTTRTASGPGR